MKLVINYELIIELSENFLENATTTKTSVIIITSRDDPELIRLICELGDCCTKSRSVGLFSSSPRKQVYQR